MLFRFFLLPSSIEMEKYEEEEEDDEEEEEEEKEEPTVNGKWMKADEMGKWRRNSNGNERPEERGNDGCVRGIRRLSRFLFHLFLHHLLLLLSECFQDSLRFIHLLALGFLRLSRPDIVVQDALTLLLRKIPSGSWDSAFHPPPFQDHFNRFFKIRFIFFFFFALNSSTLFDDVSRCSTAATLFWIHEAKSTTTIQVKLHPTTSTLLFFFFFFLLFEKWCWAGRCSSCHVHRQQVELLFFFLGRFFAIGHWDSFRTLRPRFIQSAIQSGQLNRLDQAHDQYQYYHNVAAAKKDWWRIVGSKLQPVRFCPLFIGRVTRRCWAGWKAGSEAADENTSKRAVNKSKRRFVLCVSIRV